TIALQSFPTRRSSDLDINNTFANSNKSTIQFTQEMSLIKECLLEKIYSMNIFSKGLTFLNKAIVLCSILISINMPQIFLNSTNRSEEHTSELQSRFDL